MRLVKRTLIFIIGISLFLISCQGKPSAGDVIAEPTTTSIVLPTSTPVITAEPRIDPVEGQNSTNDYALCGEGDLIPVPFFFKDQLGNVSPTQLVRVRTTADNVRRYVSVITCLEYDEGWVSNPKEVESGYENVIIFFDKYGKGHAYRIIIGGHYIAPYDSSHKDITASFNGVNVQFFTVDDWIKATKNEFLKNGSRQIGVDIYLEDDHGDLSKVLEQVYKFRDTNLQIEEALKTGEGYPDVVPDGFYLFAMESWLITTD